MKKEIKGIKWEQWILMSHEQKVEHLKSQYSDRYLAPFIKNGIRYDYRVDPDEFIKQKRLDRLQKSKIQQKKPNIERPNRQKQFKDSTLNENEQIKAGEMEILYLQQKCQELRNEVIDIMKADNQNQNRNQKSKSNKLKLQNQELQFYLSLSQEWVKEQVSQSQPSNKNKPQKNLKKKRQQYFWYEGVKFVRKQDPQRYQKYYYLQDKKYRRKCKSERTKKKQEIGVAQYRLEQQNENLSELQAQLKIFQRYKRNLNTQLKRLEKKRLLLQQKSKQNESQQQVLEQDKHNKRKDKQFTIYNCFFWKRESKLRHTITIDETPKTNTKSKKTQKFSIISIYNITISCELFYINIFEVDEPRPLENEESNQDSDAKQKQIFQAIFGGLQVVKQEPAVFNYFIQEKKQKPITISEEKHISAKQYKKEYLKAKN